MSFVNPEYFWLFLFLLAAFVKKDFKSLSLVGFGYILTFTFIVIALTRPVLPQKPIKAEQILSDVVIGIDLSYSMHANDLIPTRLLVAKEYLNKLVKYDKNIRFGVLGFTTNAIVLSPLTQDSELLMHLFSSLDEKLIITKGSSILPALKLARKLSKSKKLSVVLFTDGGDELNYSDEAEFAKENNMVVNVLMLATNIGSTLKTEDGSLLEDEIGDIVISRANDSIRILSDSTGGVYSDDFEDILSAINSQSQKNFKTQTTIVQNIELFYYFVFIGILIFLISTTTLKKYILVFLTFLGISLNGSNFDIMEEANRLYKDGKYENALKKYEEIKSNKIDEKFIVFYNIGNTYVRLKEFEKARDAYLKSLTLKYTKEADENMQYIKDVSENKEMQTGQQKSKNKSSMARKKDSTQKKEDGGSSNMQVSAAASSASDNAGKKTKTEPQVDMSKGRAKLSSRQYELINKRQINEKKPW